MVYWLTYPTELGRAPDEIELMGVVTVDSGTGDGPMEYYVFRFRTNPPHWAAKDGYMSGISGPFLKKDSPTTDSLGDTFSELEPWDSMTADQHLDYILEIVGAARR